MPVSYEEALFHSYFAWLMPNETIVQGDTDQLDGQELDMYFPDRKAAFEIGSWGLHSRTQDKDTRKRRKAKRRDIRLVTLFTDRDRATMPKADGEPLMVAPCPNSPSIIWAATSIRWTSGRKGRITRTRFLQIAEPVCEALDFTYKPVPEDQWPTMRDEAACACETLKLKSAADGKPAPGKRTVTPAAEPAAAAPSQEIATADGAATELRTQPAADLPTIGRVCESLHRDWMLVFATIAGLPDEAKTDYARRLVTDVFPTAIGYAKWPQPVQSRFHALGQRALDAVTVQPGDTDAERTLAVVGALQQAYRQCREHARTASLAMGSAAAAYRLG